MRKLHPKHHVFEQPHFTRLSAGEKAKVNKLIAIGIPAAVIFWMACANYVTTRVWHWPFFLAYYVGPIFGGVLALVGIFAPIWALLNCASAAKKAEREKAQAPRVGQATRPMP